MTPVEEISPATDTPPISLAVCANCGTELTREYCPACGQKRIQGRLQFRQLTVEFFQTYFEVDRGFLFTIREMTRRPGLAANEFLAGRRKPFIKPVQFYLITITLYFLVTEALGVDLIKMSGDMNNGIFSPHNARKAESAKVLEDFYALFGENIKIIFSVMVFVTAWVMKLLYRRSAYTFTELLVFNLYTHGITFLFSISFIGFLAIDLPVATRTGILVVFTLVYILYFSWAIYQFYPRKGVGGMVKAIATYSMAFVVYILMSGIVGILFAIWSRAKF